MAPIKKSAYCKVVILVELKCTKNIIFFYKVVYNFYKNTVPWLWLKNF